MRNISQAAIDIIAAPQGNEPITVVEIYWVYNSTTINRLNGQPMRGPITGLRKVYADRVLDGIDGKIIDVGNLETTVNIDSNSNTQVISVTLDDNDGALKNLFDNNDIHKKMVFVKQWFYGISLDDAFIIFEGEIASPIIWKEGDRTLSFNVVSKIEDQDVGFSVEDGDFDFIPNSLIGKAWPLIFGNVARVPGIQLNDIPYPITQDAISLTSESNIQAMHDISNENQISAAAQISEAYKQAFLLSFKAGQYKQLAENNHFDPAKFADYNKQAAELDKQANQILESTWTIGANNQPYFDPYEKERLELNKTAIPIINPTPFPPGVPVTVSVGAINFKGAFSADGSSITPTEVPAQTNFGSITTGPLTTKDTKVVSYLNQTYVAPDPINKYAGQLITITINLNVRYLIALNHCGIKAVYGKIKFNGLELIIPIPGSYYVVTYETYGAVKCTIITMLGPLSSKNEGWSDDIWVDLASPLGTNPIDVLKYLINTYTTHAYNVDEFAYVRTQVERTPVGFILQERKNIVQLLQEIAYQIRCALWFSNGTFRIKFLPKQDTPVATITEDDIEANSMEITTTETENLVTKYIATWRETGSQEAEYRVIFKYAINKYGLISESHSFYIFNNFNAVQLSAIFWLIRKANTWKKIKFDTFLTNIRIEPFDSILLSFSKPYICNTDVVGVVESVGLSTATSKITITCWIPVRFGEMNIYSFAHPEDITGTIVYPEPGDNQAQPVTPKADLLKPTIENTKYSPIQLGGTQNKTTVNSSGQNAPLSSGNLVFNKDIELPGITGPYLSTPALPPQPPLKVSKPLLKKDSATTLIQNGGTFSGQVISKTSDFVYKVAIYFQGINETATDTDVKQLQIDPEEEIPTGTWCIVNQTFIYTKSNNGAVLSEIEYTMQIPVWEG